LTARAPLVDEIEKLLPRAFVNIVRRRCHFPRNLDLIEHKLAPGLRGIFFQWERKAALPGSADSA